jgi:peptide alpha-N-acetyltransferase
MFLQRYGEASEHYAKLVKKNPEHHVYILAYMASLTQFHRFWPPLPAPSTGEQNDPSELPLNIQSFPPTVHPGGMPLSGWLPPLHALKSRRRVVIGSRQYKRRFETYEPVAKLTDEEEEAVCKFFDDLHAAYPKSDSVQRILLYFISGQRFQRRLDEYLRPRFRKGIPSLFRMLRPLYFQEGKLALIEQLVTQYLEHLHGEIAWYGPGVGDDAAKPPDSPQEEESPSTLLFVLMLAAEHYDLVGDTTPAL